MEVVAGSHLRFAFLRLVALIYRTSIWTEGPHTDLSLAAKISIGIGAHDLQSHLRDSGGGLLSQHGCLSAIAAAGRMRTLVKGKRWLLLTRWVTTLWGAPSG